MGPGARRLLCGPAPGAWPVTDGGSPAGWGPQRLPGGRDCGRATREPPQRPQQGRVDLRGVGSGGACGAFAKRGLARACSPPCRWLCSVQLIPLAGGRCADICILIKSTVRLKGGRSRIVNSGVLLNRGALGKGWGGVVRTPGLLPRRWLQPAPPFSRAQLCDGLAPPMR